MILIIIIHILHYCYCFLCSLQCYLVLKAVVVSNTIINVVYRSICRALLAPRPRFAVCPIVFSNYTDNHSFWHSFFYFVNYLKIKFLKLFRVPLKDIRRSNDAGLVIKLLGFKLLQTKLNILYLGPQPLVTGTLGLLPTLPCW